MKLQGIFVDFMCEANPKYREYICYENGVKTLYLKLLRALYGCIESALLWYELFVSKLEKMGFILNPYDKCVANKIIDGKQCTISWHVDDNKVSHADPNVVSNLIRESEKFFGTFAVTRGNKHRYVGINIALRKDKKIEVDMIDEIKSIIEDFSENIVGKVTSPATRDSYDTSK